MSDTNPKTFERDTVVTEPGIVGARWWNRALADEAAAVSRRDALAKLVVGAGVLGAVAACGAGIVAAVGDDYETRREPSLDAQRRYGWNLGARDKSLTYPPEALQAPSPEALASLLADLTPVAWRHVHLTTVFEAPFAVPTANLSEETVAFHPMSAELRVGASQSALAARLIGAALASLFRDAGAHAGLVLDLAGHDSVAFAAGAASVFDPVSGIANWPHPLGVIPVHHALAVAVWLLGDFRQGKTQRGPAPPPCFIFDRQRLAPTVADNLFDNRHLAQLPSAATLRAGGVGRLLYVVPTANDLPELDDLNEDLVALVQAGIEVKALALSDFRVTQEGAFYGDKSTHGAFWWDYPWARTAYQGARAAVDTRPRLWTPARRTTRFSRTSPPSDFARVGLIVAGTAVLGTAFDRRGSWNRVSSSWGGG